MSFKPYQADPSLGRRSQGPMKIRVNEASNGRSTLSFSAAIRDYFKPTVDEEARYPDKLSMKVEVLMDPETDEVMVRRVADDEDVEAWFYEVRGLHLYSGACYISGWEFGDELGLKPGGYLCQATTHQDQPAVTFRRADVEPPQKRSKKGSTS